MAKATGQYSIIDIGSNSFQQIIARVSKNHNIKYIDRQKTTLRLLDFASKNKVISDEKIDEAIKVLNRYKDNALFFNAAIVASASSATREATNGAEFLGLIKKHCNIEVELISGTREAYLVFNAVKAHFPHLYTHACVMDIGGGSFEIVYGTGTEIVFRKSLPLGVVRLSQMFFTNYQTTAKSIAALRRHVSQVLHETLEPLTVPKKTEFVGTSGAFRVICNILSGIEGTKRSRFSVQDLQMLSEKILPLSTTAQRKKLLESEPERADILPASIILMEEIVRQLNAPRIRYAPFGLREGLLFEKAGLLPK
ncbi:MAG: hypothetical protein HYV28_04755 [Ignavibacteriales bacterium]|nr:hypothetical protein [Ignavibacteriales bacterium]